MQEPIRSHRKPQPGEVRRYTRERVSYGRAAKRLYNVFRLTGCEVAMLIRTLFDESAALLCRLGQYVWQLVMGEYRHYDQCRFCFSDEMTVVIDFGDVPLAGGFFRRGSTQTDFDTERLYPLQICFCPECYLLQVNNVIDGSVLFTSYFYFSSAITTLVDHFEQYARELKTLFPDAGKRFIVEIGCNDGVFLKPLRKQGFNVLGVDPATNVVRPLVKEGYQVINDFFTEDVAKEVCETHGRADVILSSNSFAHIDDMHNVMRGIKALLEDDGILALEVHYLGTLIEEVQYDMMYHEHHSYYSLLALANLFDGYDMEVYDVKPISIHAGSMRFYVQNKEYGQHEISEAVIALRKSEKEIGLDRLETFQNFSEYINKTKDDLLALLGELKKQGKSIAGYGASGRATAIMSFCGIDDRYLDYVVDDAPAKQGAFTPGNHLLITSPDVLSDERKRPDYCLVFAWSFVDEIKRRRADYLERGGKFIVPLPEVKVIESSPPMIATAGKSHDGHHEDA